MIHYQARLGPTVNHLTSHYTARRGALKKRGGKEKKERKKGGKKKVLDGPKSALNYFPYAEALRQLITAGGGVFMPQ